MSNVLLCHIQASLHDVTNQAPCRAFARADIRETLKSSERWEAGDRAFPTAYITDPDFTTSKVCRPTAGM